MKKEGKQSEPTKVQGQTKDYASMEAKLKKQHGVITKIEFVPEKDETLVAYLRQPTLAELDGTLVSLQTAQISSAVGLFRTLFVGGDDELLDRATEPGIAIAISSQIQKTIPLVYSQSTTV